MSLNQSSIWCLAVMRVLKPWSLKLLVVAYLSWLLGTLWKTALQTATSLKTSSTILQRPHPQEWTPTNVVLQSIALCHSVQGAKYLPKCFLHSSAWRRGHHIFIMRPLVSVCFGCSSRERPYAGLSFADSVFGVVPLLPPLDLSALSRADRLVWLMYWRDWRLVSYCFLHQCSVASVTRLVCPLYVDAHVLGRLYTAIFGRPNHRERKLSSAFGPLSLCETGSSMAMVTVLRPNITCDKILSLSESWDLIVWLLLQPMPANQPIEMQYKALALKSKK